VDVAVTHEAAGSRLAIPLDPGDGERRVRVSVEARDDLGKPLSPLPGATASVVLININVAGSADVPTASPGDGTRTGRPGAARVHFVAFPSVGQ